MKKSARRERVVRHACWILSVAATLILARGMPAEIPSPPHGWKFDVVHLRTGKTFQGLVLKNTPGIVLFQCIWQPPGEPTKLGPVTTFAQYEVLRIDPLDAKERADLEARLEKLKPACEKERLRAMKLEPVPWDGVADAGLVYRSDHFVLISNAREDLVRRAGLRLEQIYDAYARFLPPRCRKATRTQIVLVRSLAEYRRMLAHQASAMLNPAFFDPDHNQIVCATDLHELADKLDKFHKDYEHLRDLLRDQQALLHKMKNPPPEAMQELVLLRAKLDKADKENTEAFERATGRLFQTLYHEAFHAYLAGFVYAPAGYAVPRWLNEGLAQIFETAILEAGELRVGHADPERLRQVKEALRKKQMVAVEDLLKAEPDKFLVGHANQQQVSDSYYLGSWALAFYLTFAQRKLGTPELDEYICSLRSGAPPQDAFCKLMGEPLPAFEESFHRYLRNLRTDGGTVR